MSFYQERTAKVEEIVTPYLGASVRLVGGDSHLWEMNTNPRRKFVWATCTSPIMPLSCPPKFSISIAFKFSWDSCNTQEKRKTKVGKILGGE